eukprot:TRINITY_DN1235_c0_g1_i2.p2 TRINITY_DN1235_c0_g1~~TRINITY_DN1235_c0_g1_i2.p2  ORF type:complete len:460 (-),score=136.61 TRINITY_DN1235_c0_g1_i2:1415-2794(-)
MRSSVCVLLLSLAACAVCVRVNVVPDAPGDVWASATQILQEAVVQGVFPGCTAVVGTRQGVLYSAAVGNFTYGTNPPYNSNNPPMTLDTRFDMASCTKVSVTTTAIAQFYQRGEISLHDPIAKYLGPRYNSNGKAGVTIMNCLLHNTGYPADPIPSYASAQFACPSSKYQQPPLTFSCQARIFQNLLNQTLQNPIGKIYIYSDLSMITLAYVVGALARDFGYITEKDLIQGCDQGGDGNQQCYYEAYVRRYVVEPLHLEKTGFLPPQSVWNQCAPTENDTTYLNRVIQGQVSDGNAYAEGGISGHAGLFSTASDMFVLMQNVMYANGTSTWMNHTTMSLFTKEYNNSQSSRALGWNTNDPTVFDSGWNMSCGSLSPRTWMHTGYTGTMLCGDPDRELIVVLLTNRVYPTDTNNLIRRLRQVFTTEVQKIFDANFADPKATTPGTPTIHNRPLLFDQNTR